MVTESKETYMDMPDNSGMAAEAVKEVNFKLYRLNGLLRI